VLRGGDLLPDVAGQRVIVLQAKWTFGMSLLGQAYFSIRLMEKLDADVVRSVAICRKEDPFLCRIAREVDSRLEVCAVDLDLRPTFVSGESPS
jgi:hypothetical protein